jgi:hypothetical protein
MNRIYAQYFAEMFPTRTTVAPLAPIDRTPTNEDTYPGLEQISFVAVRWVLHSRRRWQRAAQPYPSRTTRRSRASTVAPGATSTSVTTVSRGL